MKGNTSDDFKHIGSGMTKADLLAHLENETQVLQDGNVMKAFKKIDRADFVPPDYVVEAYEDYALPLGHEQTISQPTTVAFMLELLELNEGNSVLDIGSGSGWTTALIAEIVGKDGEVVGREIVPELVEMGQANLEKYDFPHAHIEDSGREFGAEKKLKFDRILVSADSEEIPTELLAQLKPHGIMVIPVQNAIHKLKKISDEDIQDMSFPGFNFIPLKS